MSRIIQSQRCYQIPKNKLDIFLVKLKMCSSHMTYFEAEYVFENGDVYDVIVNQYGGGFPYIEKELKEFISQLKGATNDQETT